MSKDVYTEIWEAIEELRKDSHPPVDWNSILVNLLERVEALEKAIKP
jgi:hypothetical protein